MGGNVLVEVEEDILVEVGGNVLMEVGEESPCTKQLEGLSLPSHQNIPRADNTPRVVCYIGTHLDETDCLYCLEFVSMQW